MRGPDELMVEFDEGFRAKNDPDWIHGKKAEAPFDDLKAHERFIWLSTTMKNIKTEKSLVCFL
ncbi:hypothetical protein C2I27_22895 [Priestia megaterium]|uniref:hypothetical protein n=1 Tax=Priestia megaterium TaxID=1404 RepID=UPI000D50A286|nr:hypothetical protein [Priestia megaterium]PVC63338.1 hypothetical protein C2I27_22895 [Priestia megaterium]